MGLLVRKEKGDILGLEEVLEILSKEFLVLQGQSDPLENLAVMEHQAYVDSQVLNIVDNCILILTGCNNTHFKSYYRNVCIGVTG
jgi:hypothetical protein